MGKFEGMTFQLVFNFFENAKGSTDKEIYFPPIFMTVNAFIKEINVQSTNSYPYRLTFEVRRNEIPICKIILPAYHTSFNTTKFDPKRLNLYDRIDVVVHNDDDVRLDNVYVNIMVTAGEKYLGDYDEEVDIILNSESQRIER